MRYEDMFEDASPDMFNHIEQTSKEYIESGLVLYRGSTGNKSNTTKLRKVRKDRKPTDTNTIIHDMIDLYFYNKYKILARSTTVFTTPNITTALGYGVVVAVIPKGKAKYIYSNTTKDLFHIITKPISQFIGSTPLNDIVDTPNELISSDMSLNQLGKVLADKYGSTQDIPSDLYHSVNNLIHHILDGRKYKIVDDPNQVDADNVEVMVACDEFYTVGRDSPESYKLEAKYRYLI